MESDTPKAELSKVIQIDETKLRGQLGDLVRESVEETLNALLEVEADELCQAKRYGIAREARGDSRLLPAPKSGTELRSST